MRRRRVLFPPICRGSDIVSALYSLRPILYRKQAPLRAHPSIGKDFEVSKESFGCRLTASGDPQIDSPKQRYDKMDRSFRARSPLCGSGIAQEPGLHHGCRFYAGHCDSILISSPPSRASGPSSFSTLRMTAFVGSARAAVLSLTQLEAKPAFTFLLSQSENGSRFHMASA